MSTATADMNGPVGEVGGGIAERCGGRSPHRAGSP
jgi:hypothetical protein